MLVQERIDRFHRDGFLVIPQLFSGKELELLRQAAQRVQQEGRARLGSGHLYHTHGDVAEVYFRSERMWDRDPIFRAVTVNPDLLSAVGQCIGHSFFPSITPLCANYQMEMCQCSGIKIPLTGLNPP